MNIVDVIKKGESNYRITNKGKEPKYIILSKFSYDILVATIPNDLTFLNKKYTELFGMTIVILKHIKDHHYIEYGSSPWG